ncbi:MAG: branched-chain amino acid ABC transporter ATP-binding protein/permease [Pusillimonas sp.]
MPSSLLRPTAAVIGVGVALLALALSLDNDFYLRILFMGGVYFLCATGMNVLAGYAGQKSLGQAGLFAAGAYSVALFTTLLEIPAVWALAASPFIAAAAGVLIALPSLRVKGPSLALVTLAFGIVVEKVVTEWTDLFGGAQGVYGIVPLSYAGEPFTMQQWVLLVIVLCVVAHIVTARLLQGRFGRALLSLQTDEIAAECMGIAVYRYKTLAFVIAAAFCGLGGALIAQQNQYFNSDFVTFHLSIFILLLVLLGGAGRVHGPLAGAIVLTLAETYLAQWPFAQHFVYGALLLFALYLMPQGIVGLFDRLPKRKRTLPAIEEDPSFLRGRDSGNQIALLTLKGIGKAFGGVVTASDVDLSVESRRIHALIGPNGAGKSTLINIITGVIASDAGSIILDGQDITRASPHHRAKLGIARTFQNLRLFGNLTVIENVLVGAHTRLPGRTEEHALRCAAAVLAFAGLSNHAYAQARSLPYGVQRRVELARALASEPTLLLLDEPAAGLNPQETAELGRLIRKIGDLGVAVLMVEHDMGLVMGISDHIVVLDRGVVIADGSPSQVQVNPRVIEAYLGTDGDIEPEAVAC